ncbi:MAG: phosphoribosylpyrophosphate synthetase [Chitinophagaceae bacterium]|nr:phosphoribosylpyrophosphate synthetase [Chitinophagaceae bacterium]
MYAYDTLSEAINGLRERGFSVDFNLKENCLVCDNDNFHVDDFEIVEFHRFEGESNPSDQSIVYGIQSKDGIKGVLVSGYGISAEGISVAMAEKLRFSNL